MTAAELLSLAAFSAGCHTQASPLSCSLYRVPIARVAAAQAALE